MKDYVKINFLTDKKHVRDESENLRKLIAAKLYPERFSMPLPPPV